MRELEDKIAAWREEITVRGSIDRKTACELESHLRDAIDAELEEGAEHTEAFDTAVSLIGTTAELEAEFEKVYPEWIRAENVGASMVRRGYWLLAVWILLFAATRLWSQFIPAGFFESIALVAASPVMPKGAWISALLVMVTILGSSRERRDPHQLRGGFA